MVLLGVHGLGKTGNVNGISAQSTAKCGSALTVMKCGLNYIAKLENHALLHM
jgi:hypothetical protein